MVWILAHTTKSFKFGENKFRYRSHIYVSSDLMFQSLTFVIYTMQQRYLCQFVQRSVQIWIKLPIHISSFNFTVIDHQLSNISPKWMVFSHTTKFFHLVVSGIMQSVRLRPRFLNGKLDSENTFVQRPCLNSPYHQLNICQSSLVHQLPLVPMSKKII